MKRSLVNLLFVMSALAIFIINPFYAATASANSQDVMYEVKDSSGSSVSIADGYFLKPAKVTVENGKLFAQFTLKDADYVKSLSGPYGAVQVISDDGKKRVVKMQFDDINQSVNLQMHIVVPEEVAGMPYDHQHKAILQFNTDGVNIASLSAGSQATPAANDGNDNKQEKVENPKTSDNTPLIFYSILMVGSLVLLITLWKKRLAS